MANRNSKSNRKATAWLTALVVILMIACVGVGLIGYYSAGFSDWSDFEAAFGGNTDTKEPDVEDPDDSLAVTASYTPIELGDFVDRIYFNKDFDVKSLFPGKVVDTCEIDFLSSAYGEFDPGSNLYWLQKTIYVGHPTVLTETNDASADTVGIFYSRDDEDQVIYLSASCSIDGVEYEAGWQIEGDFLEISTPVDYSEELFNDNSSPEIIAGALSCEVRRIWGQNLLKYFISTDGIFATESADEYAPVEAGDVVRKLYFNTKLDLKEFVSEHYDIFGFAMFSPRICLDGDRVRLMCLPAGLLYGNVESFEDFNAVKDEFVFLASISVLGGSNEVRILYSSCTFESAEYGTIEVPGWQVDSLDLVEVYGKGAIVGSIDNIQPVTGANIFKYFVSQSEVFAD